MVERKELDQAYACVNQAMIAWTKAVNPTTERNVLEAQRRVDIELSHIGDAKPAPKEYVKCKI